MSRQRTHYVTSADGTTIGGTVHGDGPPLVLLQGWIGDADIDWLAVAAHLTDRFTCHLVSNRGRGLTGDSPDLSPGRLIEDAVAYVESIGQPVGLIGWSGGASIALAVAAQSDSVRAAAPFESGAVSLIDEQEQAALGQALSGMGELASHGDLEAAARRFAEWPFSEQEVAQAADAGYFEKAARYVPNALNFWQQVLAYEGPHADDTNLLSAVSAPVFVLRGENTNRWIAESARHFVDHIPNGQLRIIPGVGHAAPLTHPQGLAAALAEVLAPAEQLV